MLFSICVRNNTYCFLVNSLCFCFDLDVFVFILCSLFSLCVAQVNRLDELFWHKISPMSNPSANQNTITKTKTKKPKKDTNLILVSLMFSAVTSIANIPFFFSESKKKMDRKSRCFDQSSKCVATICICKLT